MNDFYLMSTLGNSKKKQMSGVVISLLNFLCVQPKKCLPSLGLPLFMQQSLLSSTQFLCGKSWFIGRHKTSSCLCEVCSSPPHSKRTEGWRLPLGHCPLACLVEYPEIKMGPWRLTSELQNRRVWMASLWIPGTSICPLSLCLARAGHSKVHWLAFPGWILRAKMKICTKSSSAV